MEGTPREIVIGRNSAVWTTVSAHSRVSQAIAAAIGHREVPQFRFGPNDRVWVFSYSRLPVENSRLLQLLEVARVREVVYVSSASTIVNRFTSCYQYPRVKQLAEREAIRRLGARILTLGLVYRTLDDLPCGSNIATAQARIGEFMLAPEWPHDRGTRMRLFERVDKPFERSWELAAYRLYGALQWWVRRWPCILRPLDYALRAIGIRWYGYIHLSNRLWISTIS